MTYIISAGAPVAVHTGSLLFDCRLTRALCLSEEEVLENPCRISPVAGSDERHFAFKSGATTLWVAATYVRCEGAKK